MSPFRIVALGAVGVFALSVAACGKDDDEDKPRPTPASLVAGTCNTPAPDPAGPGDVADHVPLSAGSWWVYRVVERAGTEDPAPGATRTWRQRVDVTGTREVGEIPATVTTVSALDNLEAGSYQVLLAKRGAGLLRLPESQSDLREAAIGVYQVLAFPLESGRSFVQTHCNNLDLKLDADRDSSPDLTDLHAEVTVFGSQSVTVPAGTFAAVRVDTRTWTAVQKSSGGATAKESIKKDWYMSGVGLVRSTTEDASGQVLHEESLLGYHVGDEEGGFLELRTYAVGLASASSTTDVPGQPAIAFDGASHLLVSTVSTGAYEQDTLRAHLLGADGIPGAALTPTTERGQRVRPAVAFNGTHHLVVSSAFRNGTGKLVGQRMTPQGELLDGEAGFVIPGSAITGPAVASDGYGWLVVRTEHLVEGVRATAIGADGGVDWSLGIDSPFSTVAASPAIAYGGGQYLVAWAEDAIAIRGVRVSPDGDLLDSEPIVISSVPSPKTMGGIAWDGARFLVTWTDARRGETSETMGPVYDVYAARVAPDGEVLDPEGIVVNALPKASKLEPSVAAVQGGFAVAWWIDGYQGAEGIYAARLTSSGVLIDAPVDGTGFDIARPTRFGTNLAHPVLVPASDGRSLIAWVQNDEVSGETKAIRGAVLAW